MYKTLLVDDEELVIDGMKRRIDWDSLGISICGSANDGQEALAIALKAHPNIVITDINMPIMDGLMLIEDLKKNNIECEILVLSGYSDFEYAQKAMHYGVSDYLLKPCSTEDIICAVNEIKKKLDQNKQTKQLMNELLYSKQRNDAILLSNLFISILEGKTLATANSAKQLINLVPSLQNASFRIAIVETQDKIDDSSLAIGLNICNDILQKHSAGFAEKLSLDCFAIMLIEKTLNKTNNLSQILKSIERSIQSYLNVQIHIFMSELSNDLYALSTLYNQATMCLQNKYLFSDNSILSFELLKKTKSINVNKNSISANIIKYIEKNYAKNISLDDIANEVYLTPNYITTLFKRDTGTTYKKYLTNIRIVHAKRLLKDPKIKIRDIAYMVGYDNDEYFCRVFKQAVKYTPSEYRKLQT